jgi:hypothetical protein
MYPPLHVVVVVALLTTATEGRSIGVPWSVPAWLEEDLYFSVNFAFCLAILDTDIWTQI